MTTTHRMSRKDDPRKSVKLQQGDIALRTELTEVSTVMQGIDLDEGPNARPVQEQLRDALSANAVRVIDLFRDWDDDGDGTVSKKEFRKAMPLLGFNVPRKEIDLLFESFDPDGSGTIELGELNALLRRGGGVQLDESLEPGAAGAIVLESKAKHALRKGKLKTGGTKVLAAVKLQAGSGQSIQEQLREALSANAVRVVDLFKAWDDNGDGMVSSEEFQKGVNELELDLSTEDIVGLFTAFDSNSNGSIEV